MRCFLPLPPACRLCLPLARTRWPNSFLLLCAVFVGWFLGPLSERVAVEAWQASLPVILLRCVVE